MNCLSATFKYLLYFLNIIFVVGFMATVVVVESLVISFFRPTAGWHPANCCRISHFVGHGQCV